MNSGSVSFSNFSRSFKLLVISLQLLITPVLIQAAADGIVEDLQNSLREMKVLLRSQPEHAQLLFDSLKHEASMHKGELVQGYIQFYEGLFLKVQREDDLAWEAYSLTLPIAQKHNDYYLLAYVTREMGSFRNQLGDHVGAIEYYYESIAAGEKVDAFKVMGASYSLIGNLFRVLGDYYQAIEFTLLAEQNYSKAGYEEGRAWILYTLGMIYLDLNIYEDALTYLEKSLVAYDQVALETGDSLGIAICNDQIGKAMYEKGELIKAQKSFARSNKIYTLTNQIHGKSITFKNMGKVAYKMEEYDRALDLLRQAYENSTAVNAVFGLSTIYEFVGKSLYAKHQYQAGIDSLELGLKYAKISKQRPIQKNLYGTLAQMHYERGHEEIAFKYFIRQAELADSLSEKTASLKLAGLNIYEMEQRRQKIHDLEIQNQLSAYEIRRQRNIQMFLLLGGSVAILFSLLATYLYYSKRKTLILVEEQRGELEQLVATKDKFFSIIAHDLRGPLGITMQTLETILEMFPEMSRDEIFDMLKALDSTSTTTFKLLENLLMWARLQSETLVAKPQHVDVHALIEATLEMNQSRAAKKGVQLENHVNSGQFSHTDSDMLATILRNLISNALKFTSKGGTVEISATRMEATIQIEVKDTGIGIPESKLPQMFTVGNKFNRKGTAGEESSGLGLILVKEFVELQEGTIQIQSVEGEGTRVSFTIRAGEKRPLL